MIEALGGTLGSEAGVGWHRVGRGCAALLVALVMLGAVLPAQAEGRRIVSEAYGVSVERPEGWHFEDVPEGVLTAFALGARSVNRIELRVSPRVPVEHKAAYLGAFRHAAQSAWQEQIEPREVKYGPLEGTEMVFAGAVGQRVVAFAFFRDKIAYVLIGYFEAASWESRYADFQSTVRSVQFTTTEKGP